MQYLLCHDLENVLFYVIYLRYHSNVLRPFKSMSFSSVCGLLLYQRKETLKV